MEDRLRELSLRVLVDRLATGDPVPGGGSAAALAGAMGAALLGMVVELTARHAARSNSDSTNGSSEELTEIAARASLWQSELLNLAELDATAFASVIEARRLPRGTDLERQSREVQVTAAVREATRAPLETLRTANNVVDLAARLAAIASPNAVSDVGVAALLAAAAARGAALNVRINLPQVRDDELREEAIRTLGELEPGLTEREREVAATVEERLS